MKYQIILLLAVLAMFAVSCGDDEGQVVESGLPPIILLEKPSVEVPIGWNDTIRAKVTHGVGIKSIHLYEPKLFLDKTIDFSDSLMVAYDLWYKIKVNPDSAVLVDNDSLFNVKMTATSLFNMESTVDHTIKVVPKKSNIPNVLYIIGDGIGIDNGSWYDPGKATKLTPTGTLGEFTITTKFEDESSWGVDNNTDYGVYFYFVGQTSGYTPINYGVLAGEYDDPNDDGYVHGGDNTYELTPPDEGLSNIDNSNFIIYNNMAGTYTITVNIVDMTCRVTKQ